ncbi:MAG: DUF1854 domain-containing protein [Candidatus Latescibacterota bacterium]|jgi:hypothetical protein
MTTSEQPQTEPTQTAEAPAKAEEQKPSITPITVTHPEHVEISAIRLFREPPWILRLTIEGDRSYTRVKVVRAAPLSHPDRYVCLLDGRDEEICMLEELGQVPEEMQGILREELERRYLTSRIEQVKSVRNEFGTSYWEVQTNRGPREFVVQNAAENAQWLGDHRLLLIDVDGNRFEVPRLSELDKRSLALIEQIL